jgi:hypothetical protein
VRQKAWEEDNEALKEEDKKAEYAIFDLIKANDASNEKVRKIKPILEE